MTEKAAMENIQTTHPLELIHLDFLTNEATESGKDGHLLVIMDHFMWSAQALVTSLWTVKCTAQALWDIFIVHNSYHSTITDQGWNFESDLTTGQCKSAKVQKLHTNVL